jgi:hypothetical protein
MQSFVQNHDFDAYEKFGIDSFEAYEGSFHATMLTFLKRIQTLLPGP